MLEYDKKKANKQWNKFGPEGKQLSQGIIQGISDGTLDVAAPKYMTLYNKNPGIYGKFSKDCFRNNFKSALKDYSSAIAMGHSATGEYHVCDAIFDNSTNLPFSHHIHLLPGHSHFPNNASSESFLLDEDDFTGRGGMLVGAFAAQSIILPHLLWEWQDEKTAKHVTIRFLLPSGCSEHDVTATIQPGGMSVVLTYAWLDTMFDPSRILEMYSSPSGELMYPCQCTKSVALSSKVRSIEESTAGGSESFKSTYEVALPFPCQEQFTPIQSKVAGHPGIEFLKLYHHEKQTWVCMLNLEMTGIQSSYQNGAKVIPTRVFESKRAATISDKSLATPMKPTPTELSDFLSHLTSVLGGRVGNVHHSTDGATQNGQEGSNRKRPCPTGDVNPITPEVPEVRDDAEESNDYNV